MVVASPYGKWQRFSLNMFGCCAVSCNAVLRPRHSAMQQFLGHSEGLSQSVPFWECTYVPGTEHDEVICDVSLTWSVRIIKICNKSYYRLYASGVEICMQVGSCLFCNNMI